MEFIMNTKDFFLSPKSVPQKQYEALRMYFIDQVPATEVAQKFGYTYRGFTTTITVFKKELALGRADSFFFAERKLGRKKSEDILSSHDIIFNMRQANHSVDEIKTVLDSKGFHISEKSIFNIIRDAGFPRLDRRTKTEKEKLAVPSIEADKSVRLGFDEPEEFKSNSGGIVCLLPYIESLGIRKIIERSGYPGTKQINTLNSILSFVALKASNVRRYTADNVWCMDRGGGLFAGLNVLPKAAWFTSYSHKVTSDMNKNFLMELSKKWKELGLLGDTVNLDFTTIPYWGDAEHLENNWSGKRTKALPSILAVLAQDSQSGIIDYGDVNILHKNESAVVLEFLDFYKKSVGGKHGKLIYFAFDSKFTNYENLSKANQSGVMFITIRRRGKNIVEHIENADKKLWKKIRVQASANKGRTLNVLCEEVALSGYEGKVRQISITGNGKIKPAILITNDFDLSVESLVRKYAQRWLIEKEISEQISFFHLNNVSSSMVIKVDFDLTMSILTHNLFRLFAQELERYEHVSDQTLYEKFLLNTADVCIDGDEVVVKLKKKRNLPLILQSFQKYRGIRIPWLGNKQLVIEGANYS